MFNKDALKRTLLTATVSLLLAIFFSFLASAAISPVYGIYEGSNFTYDPALFKYEALAILEGQTPYIDFYDHKGVWHLGIYVLAMLISKDYGLIILEIISGTIVIFFFLETIKTLTSSLIERHIAIFYFAIIRFLVGTGATIGMWLLPFAMIYLFFFVKALKENKENLFVIGSIFLGLTVSFALNSRPLDMIYVWGGVFFLLVYCIKEKRIPLLIKSGAVAFVSFVIPVIVISIIAAANGYFNEMFHAVFLDNFAYISKNNVAVSDQIMCRILAVIALAIYVLLYFIKRKKEADKLNLFFFISGVSAFIPAILMVKFFSHFLVVTPLVALTIVYYIDSLQRENLILKKIFISLSGVAALALSLAPVAYYTFGLGDFSYSKNVKDAEALLASIPKEDRISGNIYAVDCSCDVYNLLGVVDNTKYYANQTWWSYDNPSVMEESLEYVKTTKPKYVVIWKETLNEKWEEALQPYTLINDTAERFFIYKTNA